MITAANGMHGKAVTLATMLFSVKCGEDQVHWILSEYMDDWPEEQKADLYALLVEKVKPSMTFVQMVDVVNQCLWDNAYQWCKRHG